VIRKAIGQHVITPSSRQLLSDRLRRVLELLRPRCDTRIYFVHPPHRHHDVRPAGHGKPTTLPASSRDVLTHKGHHPMLAAVICSAAAVRASSLIGEQVRLSRLQPITPKSAPHGQSRAGAATSVASAAIAKPEAGERTRHPRQQTAGLWRSTRELMPSSRRSHCSSPPPNLTSSSSMTGQDAGQPAKAFQRARSSSTADPLPSSIPTPARRAAQPKYVTGSR